MVFKRREVVRGCQGKDVQKKSWRVPSRLMEERSGRVNSARRQKCGRGGDADVAAMTSQRGWEVQAGGCRKNRSMVYGLFDIKW